jgi:hypothetical protein
MAETCLVWNKKKQIQILNIIIHNINNSISYSLILLRNSPKANYKRSMIKDAIKQILTNKDKVDQTKPT